MVFSALKGGNQLSGDMIAVIILLVIIVIMIIVLSCILAKPRCSSNSRCQPPSNIYSGIECYQKMNLKDQIETLKKIKAEGFQNIVAQSVNPKCQKHEVVEKIVSDEPKIEKSIEKKVEKTVEKPIEKFAKMTPKAKKLSKKYK